MFGSNKVLLRQDKKQAPAVFWIASQAYTYGSMAVSALGAAGIGAAASALGTAYSVYSGQKQAAAQEEAQEMQQRQSEVSEARKRNQAARETLLKQEEIKMAGSNLGLGQSSGVSGGYASAGSQGAERIGYSSVMEGFAKYTSQASQEAANWAGQAQIGQGIANIGSTIFSQVGGFKKQAEIKQYPPTSTIFSNIG